MSTDHKVLPSPLTPGTVGGEAESNLCWQNVADISLKSKALSCEESSSDKYVEESTSAAAGHYTLNSTNNQTKSIEVIVVSDSDESKPPSPDSTGTPDMTTKIPNSTHHGGIITSSNNTDSSADVQALKELLQKEEKRLSVLKTIHDLQGAPSNKTSIQGSALNKKGSRPFNSGGNGGSSSGRNSPNLRPAQPKHSIVVVPGHNSKTATSGATGISSRLQQLVDNIAVDQSLVTSTDKNSSGRETTVNKVVALTTPPVPSLTSITPSSHSSQKHTLAYINSSGKSTSAGLVIPQIRPKISSSTNIRSSHEVITISDSPVSKNPPPLLSSSSKIHVTSNGSIQVPTISSTVMPASASSGSTTEKVHVLPPENSRRYREYLIKQNLAKKNFQKQIERKMVVAPYPKTFRQVWPLIPVHDSGFIRHYGLEAVSHYFNSNPAQEKTASKMKPICNQCGCDFASAWQIRKSNSKQLLLCEACDFQNLKILQRTKLGNQLKELLEDIKKEEEKFGVECEEARKQVLLLEKRATESPPPLTNNSNSGSQVGHIKIGLASTLGHVNQAVLDKQVSSRVQALSNTAGVSVMKKTQLVLQHTQANKMPSTKHAPTTTNNNQNTVSVIPSILGQKSSEKKENVVTGVKRKEPPQRVSTGTSTRQERGGTPPSKMCKPGSALDLTLNRLSKQLITRKLDEHRKECKEVQQVEEHEDGTSGSNSPKEREELGVVVNVKNEMDATPSSATLAPGNIGERTKSRRKGTPKHRVHTGGTAGVK